MSYYARDILWDDTVQVPGLWTITPLDLDSIWPDTSAKEIDTLIHTYISLPDSMEEKIEYINRLYKRSLQFLKARLLYTPKEIWALNDFQFNSWEDVRRFLLDTKAIKGKIKCTIVKCMLTMNDWAEEFNERITEVKEKTARVVENKLTKPLQILEESENGNYIRGRVSLSGRIIDFNIRRRAKSDDSRVEKEIKDPDYHTVEHLSDNYWVTFEVANKDDIPLLMQYVALVTFKKGKFWIKNKDLFTYEDIESLEGMNPEFKGRLLGALKEDKDKDNNRKKETPPEYRDIKLVTPLYKDDEVNNLSLEIKFVVWWNINESWLQMHWVYAQFKKILQRIRLEQFVRPDYIERVVDDFLENLQSILDNNINRENKDLYTYKKELFNGLKREGFIPSDMVLTNSHVKANIDTYLRLWLMGYYKGLLTSAKLNSKGRDVYTNSRSVKISDTLKFWRNKLSSKV